MRKLRALPFSAAILLVLATLLAPTAAAGGYRSITLTFVRHAQSAGNASGLIDSSTPGPPLTDLGRAQAVASAQRLAPNHYDGIFASTMIRTQQTAQPMSDTLREPVTVLPGLHEVEAGIYEGRPEASAVDTYFSAPEQWLRGDRNARIPGSIDGNEFDARFDGAVQQIYDSGDDNPVAYSHGAAIMLWVQMNIGNPNPQLLMKHPLANTGYVVVKGNPTDGWILTDWDGAGS
ncbi:MULTISPECIES: histidine phosphatase family protein [unclassified Mycolicibacterium]|uniref:histidine phosphatase family protein n=1 Tax=unclassified Mycolicibacterium TaxID=2636767 RepID=UPI00130B2B38|nr:MULTISPECIES: histidine phosphatase family protein [unclassified Mycolicibacterium]MUL83114.1 histidine phosphatase family protein [Mycolicibacterium sp. CBMA 329]MUL89449.1 histidine phosphatase family protein [Mycolicibacterium sp. CBMA 331]MUL99138.1 histidine phosphatase family protein [Mycolicibacterium sp. CBMA 334]MUM24764.1 histidine phosphatase family protein [Mycolicibacterium sp. CBMA 295]MUM38965.1 histidine phosphatase family protein [Mycolicibacterium sp. CBMA 247]